MNKRKLKKRLKDFISTLKEFHPDHEKRMAICNACPSLRKNIKQCKECNCFMVAKTKFFGVTCPLGKW